MERLLSQLLFKRAQEKKKAIAPLLERCYYSAIPYIRLISKTRRRGKRVTYRVKYIERKKAEHTTLAAFTKHVSSQRNDRFVVKLEREIESFAGNKNYPVRANRNKIHKQGLKTILRVLKAAEKKRLAMLGLDLS